MFTYTVTGAEIVNSMTSHLFGTKPLPEPLLSYIVSGINWLSETENFLIHVLYYRKFMICNFEKIAQPQCSRKLKSPWGIKFHKIDIL